MEMNKTKSLSLILSLLCLVTWSGVMLYFYLSERIVNYLPERGLFREMVLISGLVMMILAIFNWITANDTTHTCCDHDHSLGRSCCDNHDVPDSVESTMVVEHHHGLVEHKNWKVRWAAWWILFVPITLAAFYTPDQYSHRAILNKAGMQVVANKHTDFDGLVIVNEVSQNSNSQKISQHNGKIVVNGKLEESPKKAKDRGTFTMEMFKQHADQTSDGYFILTLADIFYASSDEAVQEIITQVNVEIEAQLLPEENVPPGQIRMRIYRMASECCAADARPYTCLISLSDPVELPIQSWVKVRGKLLFQDQGRYKIPLLNVENINAIPAPAQEMMFMR
jgi:uncharacterized membrane protein YcgQ (UPF0703/DUF1980 family)